MRAAKKVNNKAGRPKGPKRIRHTLRLPIELDRRVDAVAGSFNSRTSLFDEIFTAGLPVIEKKATQC